MRLLIDIGNTTTHVALANPRRIATDATFPTTSDKPAPALSKLIGKRSINHAVLCSVVPKASRAMTGWLHASDIHCHPFTHQTCGISIDYPKPATIGPDRLANARAVRDIYGAPAMVVDFGTALTFDIVNKNGAYAGGIIAPGLSAMTDYLHEKTALLPCIKLRDSHRSIGRSTEEAMRIGAVHGYRGLVRELIVRVKRDLDARQLPVIATGGHAKMIARGVIEITAVRPRLTLEGLRLASLDTT